MTHDEKMDSYKRLIANPDFGTFIQSYLVDDIVEIVEDYSLDNPDTIDMLKARKITKSYIRDIIDETKIKE